MAEMEKMDDLDLAKVAGGIQDTDQRRWKWVMANVNTGYLPLRSDPSYNKTNEKDRLVSGTAFQILPEKTQGEYVYAYFNGQEGWVHSNYIKGFEMHGEAY